MNVVVVAKVSFEQVNKRKFDYYPLYFQSNDILK